MNAMLAPYSLGDAIDWKRLNRYSGLLGMPAPLLARGRDRLETLKKALA